MERYDLAHVELRRGSAIDLRPFRHAPSLLGVLAEMTRRSPRILSRHATVEAILAMYACNPRIYRPAWPDFHPELDHEQLFICVRLAWRWGYWSGITPRWARENGSEPDEMQIHCPIGPHLERAFRGLYDLAPDEELNLEKRLSSKRAKTSQAWGLAYGLALMVLIAAARSPVPT